MILFPSRVDLLHNFFGKIIDFFLDTFAHFKTLKLTTVAPFDFKSFSTIVSGSFTKG
jgi:hypothetical protein